MKATKRILIIDDESDVCEIVCAGGSRYGFDCLAATNAATFLKMLTPGTTLILLDLVMPGMDGIELLRLLASRSARRASFS